MGGGSAVDREDALIPKAHTQLLTISPLLTPLLRDSTPEVLEATADALVSLRGKKVVPVFESVMRSSGEWKRDEPSTPEEQEAEAYARLFAAAALLRLL